MGVQATMTIGIKDAATAIPVTSGAATFPSTFQVRIVTMLQLGDRHRLGDIQRAVKMCIDYARDNNIYVGATTAYIITTLDGGKSEVKTNNVASEITDGYVGIMINNFELQKGSRNIIDNAHKQLLDWMNENDRLAV